MRVTDKGPAAKEGRRYNADLKRTVPFSLYLSAWGYTWTGTANCWQVCLPVNYVQPEGRHIEKGVGGGGESAGGGGGGGRGRERGGGGRGRGARKGRHGDWQVDIDLEVTRGPCWVASVWTWLKITIRVCLSLITMSVGNNACSVCAHGGGGGGGGGQRDRQTDRQRQRDR